MSDWWAKKLSGGQQPAPRQGAPVPQAIPPEQRPMAPVPQQYAPPGQVYQTDAPLPEGASATDLVAHNSDMLRNRQYREIPAQATALKNSGGQCPSCHSGNYLVTSVGGRSHEHCHDCGYPIVQAGSGMGALGGTGIVTSGGQHSARSPQYSQRL